MIMTTRHFPLPLNFSSTGITPKKWLWCIGLQSIACMLALLCYPKTVLVLALLWGSGGLALSMGIVGSIRWLRLALYRLSKPYQAYWEIGWFMGSLLLVAVHPALLVGGLFALVQFQRFLTKLSPLQVTWAVCGATLTLIASMVWHIGHIPLLSPIVFNHFTNLWLCSFLPLLAWYAVTQIQLRSVMAVQAGALIQQSTLALTDALTGLGNRRSFDETLTREMARTKRNSSPLSLVILDIDFFKKINDVYGHTMGDTVLKELATLIASNLRQCDWLARYGGEEYALILPDTPCLEALKLLERLRLLVEKHIFARDQSPLRMTISLGITQYDVKRHTLKSLIEEADAALYEAKHKGRNQVRVYGLEASGGALLQVSSAAGVSVYAKQEKTIKSLTR
jgi:diguanylate cyclase (GGDEF)-like protein